MIPKNLFFFRTKLFSWLQTFSKNGNLRRILKLKKKWHNFTLYKVEELIASKWEELQIKETGIGGG